MSLIRFASLRCEGAAPVRVISNLTAPRGFVFSRRSDRGTSNAEIFQVEHQMVAGSRFSGDPLGIRGMVDDCAT
jgi:hypothetical protein